VNSVVKVNELSNKVAQVLLADGGEPLPQLDSPLHISEDVAPPVNPQPQKFEERPDRLDNRTGLRIRNLLP